MTAQERNRWSVAFVLAGALFLQDSLVEGSESEDEMVRKGRRIFQKYCVGCHGPEGKGDGYRLLGPNPANLTSKLSQEKSDEDLLRTIHEGRPNMPPWQSEFTKEELKDVLAYVRSLAR